MMYLFLFNHICMMVCYFTLLNDGVPGCSVYLLVLYQKVMKKHIYFFKIIYPDSLTACYQQILNGIYLLSYTIFSIFDVTPCYYISII